MTTSPLRKLWHAVRDTFANYFTLQGFLVTQAEAEEAIRSGVSFRGTNLLILVLAILIASLGLNTNSVAVMIGAMLISPLMGPIIGIGLGVGVRDFGLLRRSLRNLSVAALFSVAASALYFLISPVSEGHSELLARTSPTIYDVMIGFFGGGAGIVALASKNKGNVLPGVAIATALMPPLCTAGYGLATLQMNYLLGALYLFIINSVYIALATFLGIKLMNFHPVTAGAEATEAQLRRRRRVKWWIYAVSVGVLVPSIYLTYNMLRHARFEQNAARFVAQECHFPDTQVLSSKAVMQGPDGQGRTLTLTLIGQTLPTDSLELALGSRLDQYGLQGTHLRIIQGGATAAVPDAEALFGRSVKELYTYAQNSLLRKQTTIDSLRQVIAARQGADTMAAALAPELRVVFPRIKELAVTRALFGNVAQGSTVPVDTVTMALVTYTGPTPSAQRRQELQRYLEARMRTPYVRLVVLPAQ